MASTSGVLVFEEPTPANPTVVSADEVEISAAIQLPDIPMVFVEGGTFSMGSEDGEDDEKPVHSVTLSSYHIGKYEVTQKLWKAVMGNNPSKFKGNNRPVEFVSWDDVQVFLKKLNSITGKNYRLPTEAEWEFAARGGTKSRGYKYSGSNDIGSVAWNEDNSGSKTYVVGSKSSNELGIYDMTGNVWEWCEDVYDEYYYCRNIPALNPCNEVNGSYRVCRGGSYLARDCLVSSRSYNLSGLSGSFLGFRLAL